jgi:hypothetical protein
MVAVNQICKANKIFKGKTIFQKFIKDILAKAKQGKLESIVRYVTS